jgi:hypothetical protein
MGHDMRKSYIKDSMAQPDYCHYSLEMPVDDKILGTESFNKIHAPEMVFLMTTQFNGNRQLIGSQEK